MYIKRLFATLWLALMVVDAQAAKPTTVNVTTNNFSLYQPMNNHDATKWYIAGDWPLDTPFLSGVCQSQAAFANSILTLKLDNKACAGKPYAAAQYQSMGFYRYGYYEVKLKAAKGAGVVTGFFSYTGESDNNAHDEISIEILGKDTSKLQVNFFANGVGEHEQMIDLGFDASAAFHIYAFDWQPSYIKWYVDGKLVHSVTSNQTALPSVAGKIMANIWACDAVAWCGTYTPGAYSAAFDWIGFR